MRIFIAMDIPSKVKDYLFKFQAKIKTPLAKVSWVAKSKLHLTLKFFGELNEIQLEELKEKLKKINFNSFDVSLDSIGVFPDDEFIKIIWLGLKPDDSLIKLQHLIDSETLEIVSSEQHFRSHLTLGRVKWIKNKPQYVKFLSDFSPKGIRFRIEKFCLYNSNLTKDGPNYERLEEYSLN